MNVSVIILLVVFVLIAVRKIGRVRLQIWQIMLAGAAAALATGQIAPTNALRAINLDVMLFLFGMFVTGRALEDSGYLSHLSYKIFRKAKSTDQLIILVLAVMGLASAFLMNDTLAIIGTPVVLLLARRHGINPKLMLLTLAFAVTIGSVTSPIGNPQNLLIALNGGVANPFVTFFRFLLAPTILSMLAAFLMLKLFFREHFHDTALNHSAEPVTDPRLAALARISLVLVLVMVAAKIALVMLAVPFDFKLTYIAFISALPVVVFSPKRFRILREIDWHTLIFFAAMFVLMESVWRSGFFQRGIESMRLDITSGGMILGVSIVLSQLISNVPLVALYLPVLAHAGAGTAQMMLLAAGSTIAGNLTILGAASNVIIIQNAERRSGETITFLDFLKIGLPLTILNALTYWLFSLIL